MWIGLCNSARVNGTHIDWHKPIPDPKKKKQIQIDIVGTPVEGKDYIIGSCKYRNEKIGVDELDLIRDYASVFGKGNNYHYYIFSKGGFTDGLLQAQERGEVRLITLEDLYK